MVRLLARIVGVGVETADMLVHEVLSRPMRDRRAVARYAGLTGSPDESGARRREQGLARAGNARVRRGMIQLAWRFLMFQKQSALLPAEPGAFVFANDLIEKCRRQVGAIFVARATGHHADRVTHQSQAPTSSHHAASCCGPRRRSGSSAE